MRRLKRSTAFLQRSRNCLRGCRASPTTRDFARIKSRRGSVVSAVAAARGRNARRDACHYSSSSGGVRSRLVKSENVRLACSDLGQINVACRDIYIMPTTARRALLACDGTQGQECEHYGYSRCHDRFGREFHGDYVFCSDALRRNSFHPPPELNEVML